MALSLTLPFGQKDNIKNLVFSIMTKEYPLKIIELTNFIRKRYGKSVTFQAVRKAMLELVEDGVLIKKGKEFMINKDWVMESKKVLDNLHLELTREKTTPKGIDSIRGEVSVFTFNSVNEMMKFWENLIDNWYDKHKKGDPNTNAYQGAHGWEGLMHPDREKTMMGRLKKKGIKSYALGTSDTPLDRYIWKFYKSVGLKTRIYPSSKLFDKSYYVATYGKTIVQAHYPKKIVEAMDDFFRKNKTIKDMNLKHLSDIINKKIKVQLTVIKNLEMAKQINKSIISHFE